VDCISSCSIPVQLGDEEMAKKQTQTIRDLNGEVLYHGEAPTLKGYIAQIVNEGGSLANADLHGRNLAGLILDGGVFDNANLDDCDLRGTSMRYASFVGASLRGVQGQGVNAEYAKLLGANLSPTTANISSFDGARFAYAEFDGAILDRAVFENAGMSRASLAHARGRKVQFNRARMHDTDFSFSKFVNCDFSQADLQTSTKLEVKHLPNRTVGALSVHCRFSKTKMDGTTPGFARDRAWTRALSIFAYGVSTTAIALASHHIPVESLAETWISPIVEGGGTTVIVTALALALKDCMAEQVRDWLDEKMEHGHVILRNAFDHFKRIGANLGELVAASIKGPGTRAIREALHATRHKDENNKLFPEFREFVATRRTVIFCNRRHLALALESVCAGRTRHRLDGDIVIVRKGEGGDAPTIMRYRSDGGTSAAWTASGKIIGIAEYDVEGELMSSVGEVKFDERHIHVLDTFEGAMLADHDISLDYPRETHELRAGSNGSILVLRSGDRRPNNPDGPALVDLTGKKRYFINGVEDGGADGDQDTKGGAAPRGKPRRAQGPAMSMMT